MLFDFFANCEYFEKEFKYDQALKLPVEVESESEEAGQKSAAEKIGTYTHGGEDIILSIAEQTFPGGMKVDQMFFSTFADALRADQSLTRAVEAGRWDEVIERVNKEVLNKPDAYYTLDKLRRAAAVDRRVTLREILEFVFGLIPRLKHKDELLEEEFAKFVADRTPEDPQTVPAIKTFFKAYATSDQLRHIIDSQDFAQLHTNPGFTFGDFKAVPADFRQIVPEYVKDYVTLNQFA